MEVFFQLCFLWKSSSVDPLEHLVLFISSPVGAGQAGELKGLYIFCAHQVRACAQVCKLALGIEADHRIFRQVFDQLYLIGFVFFFKIFDSFLSWFFRSYKRKIFLYDLFHFFFDFFQILCCKGSLSVYIIVKAVCHRRTDGQLCLRIQSLNSLGHDMGSGMAESAFSFFIMKCKNVQIAVFVYWRSQIHDLPVDLSGCGSSCQSFADICCNLNDRFCFCVFFHRTVF